MGEVGLWGWEQHYMILLLALFVLSLWGFQISIVEIFQLKGKRKLVLQTIWSKSNFRNI